MKTKEQNLATYIRAKYPIIVIRSIEERRVESSVAAVAKQLDMGIRLWSIVSGFTSLNGDSKEDVSDPTSALANVAQSNTRTIFVMRDFHPFMDAKNGANVPVIRMVRELAKTLKASSKDKARTVIFVGPKFDIPEELQADVAVIDWPLPSFDELKEALEEIVSALPEEIRKNIPEDKTEIVSAAQGLTLEEAANCFARSIVTSKTLDPKLISEEKKQAVAKEGLLEWLEPEGDLSSVGGLDELKRWLVQREKAFTKQARDFGLPEPKGVAVVGCPGTGKSLTAKAAGIAWKRPVLRLDFGRLFGGILGQTEENIRKALAVAEAVAPCILFCDELEKGLGGSDSSGGSTDGGASSRLLGTFLTWLQEKKSSVFVFATLNKTEGLPPELLRAGRWDCLFHVDLPNTEEREEIFKVHLNKRNRNPKNYSLEKLVGITEGYSGAEIEAVVTEGLYSAFEEGKELDTDHLQAACSNVVPLSKTASEKIEAMRSWAKGRARPASKAVENKTTNNRFSDLA